jgi:hypothetical protein
MPEFLAERGLYVCGDGATIQCYFCFDFNIPIKELQNPSIGTDEASLDKWHKELSPYCPFQLENLHNIPISNQDYEMR